MKGAALAAALVIAVLAGAGAGFFAGVSNMTTVTSVSTMVTTVLLQACDGQKVWDSNGTTSLVPVLLMKPNSTAYACVTYQTLWKGNASAMVNPSLFVGPHQFYPLTMSNDVCKNQICKSSVSNAFRVSVFPSTIQITEHTNYVVVLYAITALTNSTGFYSHSVPYNYCDGMPMAVGHSASEVNGSDFEPLVAPPCALQALIPVSVSVSGMGFVYLKPW